MNSYIIGVLLSMLVYLVVGVYVGRKVKNINDYYVSGRNATTIFISGTMFASMLSTNGFMGDTAYAYNGNITTLVLLNTICACGYIIGGLYFGRYIRRSKANTMPTYFWQRFNSIRIRKFAGIITVVSLSAYLLSVLQGTAILMVCMTGFSKETCLLLAWSCIVFFTLYSGSKGVLITDTIMCIFFLIATIVAGQYIFNASGGISNLITNLVNNPNTPDGLLSFHGNTNGKSIFDILFYGFTMGIIWMITVAVSPWQAGRNLMVKNEHIIFRAGTIGVLLSVFFLLYLYLMAISVIQINPNMQEPERVIIWAAFEVMPELIGVLLLTGIMAAGLSSASTFLSVVSFCTSSDILDVKFKKDSSKINFTRLIVFIVSLIALGLAYLDLSSIRIIAWFASTIIAASWGYVAFASVWSKKLTEKGAYYSMVGGFLIFFITKILKEMFNLPLDNIFDPFFLAIFGSATLGILGSYKERRTKTEVDFFNNLHKIPSSESIINEYKKDRIFGWTLILAGFVISSFLIKYWAIPYNEALGTSIFK
ncbi:sodium:solute symporter [Malaciobacter marinus]|uniref:Sodium:solute symporter n=1 Tax=Malaciobacter marinus TaxID=505249 RepID=A0A347TP97_9BACT|nr:sodium:solute symporter family protein [Malaciobacter marinus]AXX88425.1 sodium:solute symporter [Malaciobacter marinus]PHO14164.1 sodium:solute symporter [Malaciobacter marinus]